MASEGGGEKADGGWGAETSSIPVANGHQMMGETGTLQVLHLVRARRSCKT